MGGKLPCCKVRGINLLEITKKNRLAMPYMVKGLISQFVIYLTYHGEVIYKILTCTVLPLIPEYRENMSL